MFALYLAFRKGTHAEKQTLQSLDSREKIGAVAGSPIEWLLHDQGRILPLIYFPSIEKALEALAAGRIDALAHPISALKAGITKMRLEETLDLSEVPVTEISHAVAVRKANKALLSRINPVIIHFRRSEEHAAIYRYWFGQPYSFWTPRRVFLVMIIVLLLLIWATIFWSYRHLLRSTPGSTCRSKTRN
jgi:ABC-type amino acid transport substrate-binding protein